MRIKTFFTLALLCMTITSCTDEEVTPNLDYIHLIYCTPTEFGKCLPLEIENAVSGWHARYIGAPTKELLTLEPIYEVDEDGDTCVVFNEYLADGKLNGKYILHRSSMFVNEYDGVSYVNSSGKDTTDFYTNIIKEGTVFTANPNVSEAIRKTMEYEGNDPPGCGTERRDLNMSYLIHSNPGTLHMPIKVEDLYIHDSPDGKLRLYAFIGYTGGNGVGSNYDIGILQYETGNGDVGVLDDFTVLLYNSLVDFGEANFPYCEIQSIRNSKFNGKIYYLIEASFSDARPMMLEGSDEYVKSDDTVLYAFTINKGKLIPAPIFGNKWLIEVVGSQETTELHYGYNDATKTVSVPIVEGEGHIFKGKYRQIKIQ